MIPGSAILKLAKDREGLPEFVSGAFFFAASACAGVTGYSSFIVAPFLRVLLVKIGQLARHEVSESLVTIPIDL